MYKSKENILLQILMLKFLLFEKYLYKHIKHGMENSKDYNNIKRWNLSYEQNIKINYWNGNM